MNKHLIIVAVLLLPTALFAQSALGQLESLAGQSIHDVYVPPVPDPTPVDVEEEEQEQQSTHLKDYTPAQEQETKPTQPKPKTAEEIWQEELKKEQQREANYWKEQEERKKILYNSFLNNLPEVKSAPVFSSIGESSVVFDSPKAPHELDYYGEFLLAPEDSLYKADMIKSSTQGYGTHFLGRRLGNGRVEWRIFTRTRMWGRMKDVEDYSSLNLPYNFNYHNIRDVKFAGEGRVVILEMINGEKYVLNPEGQFICRGKNLNFPVMSGDVLFIECDGKLYASNAAPSNSGPILTGDQFAYYHRTVIVTQHDSEGKPYYQMCSYGGHCYDYKAELWTRYGGDTSYDFVAPYNNDGWYYVIKPRGKKYYMLVCFSHYYNLYKGSKKYKTLEDAHAGWPKEKPKLRELMMYKPYKCAHTKN